MPSKIRRCYGTGAAMESAIPAEEVFPCGHAAESSCGCARETAECSRACCPLPTSCGCSSQEAVTPDPIETSCCCKASMVEALRLLCDPTLASLVDFNAFFFLTDSLAIGGALKEFSSDCADNLAAAEASFRRFSPCNCDLLDVDGTAYFAVPGMNCPALCDVEQISLCAIRAVAFQLADTEAGTCCCEPFQMALRSIRRAIHAEGGTTSACGTCGAHCDCDDCCCEAGILTELSTRNLSRLATLTAGPLILRNVTVVGSLGSVLVLADEATERFYLVCANHVEALG